MHLSLGRIEAREVDVTRQKATIAAQYGTLGSGNHFVEVSIDEAGRVWLVLHSGSRGIGNQLATRHIKAARPWPPRRGSSSRTATWPGSRLVVRSSTPTWPTCCGRSGTPGATGLR